MSCQRRSNIARKKLKIQLSKFYGFCGETYLWNENKILQQQKKLNYVCAIYQKKSTCTMRKMNKSYLYFSNSKLICCVKIIFSWLLLWKKVMCQNDEDRLEKNRHLLTSSLKADKTKQKLQDNKCLLKQRNLKKTSFNSFSGNFSFKSHISAVSVHISFRLGSQNNMFDFFPHANIKT